MLLLVAEAADAVDSLVIAVIPPPPGLEYGMISLTPELMGVSTPLAMRTSSPSAVA